MKKIKIKKNDTVVVISGKDRGKSGKILDVRTESDRVLIEGVGLKRKNQRPRKSGQKGEVITIPAPIHVSNVMLYCSHCGKGVRSGIQITGSGEKMRICKTCKNTI